MRYFVNSHIMVTMYTLLFTDFGSGPTVSTTTISNGSVGVLVTIISSLVAGFNLDFRQAGHFQNQFVISHIISSGPSGLQKLDFLDHV